MVPIPSYPRTNKDSVTNYCNLTVVGAQYKLLECHIYNLIAHHCPDHNLSSPEQWGFRPGRSTASALISVCCWWLHGCGNSGVMSSALFDLQKAFDCVPHRSLRENLISLGLDNYLLKWHCDYLTGRTQPVVINGATSAIYSHVNWILHVISETRCGGTPL